MRPGPRRPYKNFGIFCLWHGCDRGRPYPCLACRGQGEIRQPDYGERYRIERCAACNGTGEGTKEACRAAYIDAIEAYKQEKAEYQKLCYYRKEALKRLSKEEVKALRELGV